MTPIRNPVPWDLDPLVYLESRQHLLTKVARDHARWEHDLAVNGKGLFTREVWLNEAGHEQPVVITASFLVTHGKVLTSLIQDMDRLGPYTGAVAGRIVAEQNWAVAQQLTDERGVDTEDASGQETP